MGFGYYIPNNFNNLCQIVNFAGSVLQFPEFQEDL